MTASDPTAAVARTRLAWVRTALALLVTAVLVERLALRTHPAVGLAVLVTLVVFAVVTAIPGTPIGPLRAGALVIAVGVLAVGGAVSAFA